MAITINVNGTSVGGQQNVQQPQQGMSQSQSTSQQFGQYQPSSQSIMQSSGNPLLTSDAIIQDIRREMATRGVMLVPGTSNFSNMMNSIRMQQRNALFDRIDTGVDAQKRDLDAQRKAALSEVSNRVEAAKHEALLRERDPIRRATITENYDRLLYKELGGVNRLFDDKYSALSASAQSEKNDVEQRLTEAIQRLTEEFSQGNKDSYLSNLRSKYFEAKLRRDDAATEEEAKEASREAVRIQERIQRLISGGVNPAVLRMAGAGVTAVGMLANAAFTSAQISDKMEWGLGLEQASSILSGNAFQAIRQRNAYESQKSSAWWSGGMGATGALGGALLGTAVGGPIGALIGTAIGATVGALGGQLGAYYIGGNRERLREDYRVQAADLWRQEEQRMMQFNELAMLTSGANPYMQFTRNWYINQSQSPLMKGLTGGMFGNQAAPISDALDVFNPYFSGLDLYDLGYTSPEFAQKAAQRIKQRGFVGVDSIRNALYADALERVFSMSSGALGQLSAFDRFGRNNANQDFANLAVTLAALGTTGMQEGAWARSDEFAGYMGQLQSGQRGTFLTVDNARAARQIATGQAIFGDKFGAEAMQGIQAINAQVQNPGQGFTRTLLYDVIQELHPDARGDIAKIQKYMYSDEPGVQNEIQQAFAKRIASIYGSPDTTTGFLAFKEIYGIENPNVLNPLAKQMLGGGLEARGLKTADQEGLVSPMTQGGYTPEVTKKLNIAADNQMSLLLNRMDDMVKISSRLLHVLSQDTNQTLEKAVAILNK